VIFEQSGHSPFVEEPERFAQVVGPFLRESAAVPAG
jgi:pimeloyl-ACP methyl ester carboxylesterase